MSWNPFDRMAELAFKPMAGGYIYQAPSVWPFMRGLAYRVNEAQKAELLVRHRTMMRALFWTIVVGGALGGPIAGLQLHDHGWKALAVCALIGLVIGCGFNMWLLGKVRPIVAGLEPVSEKITRGDVFRRQATVFSPGFVIGFGALSVALTALSVLAGVDSGWDFSAMFGTALFGACTIYWAVLYGMKRRFAAT